MIDAIDFTNENTEMKVGNRQVLEIAKGSTILGTFRSWRLPVFSDILSGQTIRITVPASPMIIDGYDDCFYNIKGNDKRQRRLHVPKGTKDLYDKHPAFEIFDIIIEK